MCTNNKINDSNEESPLIQNNSSNGNTPSPQPIYQHYNWNYYSSPNNIPQQYYANYPRWSDPLNDTNNRTSQSIWNPAFTNTANNNDVQNRVYRNNQRNLQSQPSIEVKYQHYPHYQSYLHQLTDNERMNIDAYARNFVSGLSFQNNNLYSAREQLACYARRIHERDNIYLYQQSDDSFSTDFSSESSDQYFDLSSTSSDFQDRSDGSDDVDR